MKTLSLVVGNIGLLSIPVVSEGDPVPLCLLLSCVTCDGVDPAFAVQVDLAINSGTAG